MGDKSILTVFDKDQQVKSPKRFANKLYNLYEANKIHNILKFIYIKKLNLYEIETCVDKYYEEFVKRHDKIKKSLINKIDREKRLGEIIFKIEIGRASCRERV